MKEGRAGPGLVASYVLSALTIAEMEVRKIRHSQSELWIRAVQPVLWLLVFGEALATVRGIAPGNYPYIEFITPGILAQSVLFIAIFYGVTLVWERDLGLLTKLMASPAPRPAIIFGKAVAASIRGLFQAALVLILSLVIGTGVTVSLATVFGVILVSFLLAMCFSSLSMIIASIAKSRERMMGLSQVITFPLFFASNAIYPTSIMPTWLQLVATANPLTYGVQAMRGMLVMGNFSNVPTDVGILGAYTMVLLVLASYSIRRILS
ncbi:MAG TPA: ABC transporter permease [Nitrososphaerales archaeon]|nr:ABC transporter permease [Nitrososphaerales archaeon]